MFALLSGPSIAPSGLAQTLLEALARTTAERQARCHDAVAVLYLTRPSLQTIYKVVGVACAPGSPMGPPPWARNQLNRVEISSIFSLHSSFGPPSETCGLAGPTDNVQPLSAFRTLADSYGIRASIHTKARIPVEKYFIYPTISNYALRRLDGVREVIPENLQKAPLNTYNTTSYRVVKAPKMEGVLDMVLYW